MKLIKDGDEFILEAHKNDIPKIVKVVGQAGRHPDWVIVASSGNNHPYLQLSLENCKVIMNVVDVEKLAEECAETAHTMDELYENGLFYGFTSGFNKAMELNKDKLFTYNQMVSAITESSISLRLPSLIIQDLQSTEIDVEIVTESIGIGDKYTPEPKPLLDSEGCLILKKI